MKYRKNNTHCRNGHEYTLENTGVDCKGGRLCRICRQASNKKAQINRVLTAEQLEQKRVYDKKYYKNNLEQMKADNIAWYARKGRELNLLKIGWTIELFDSAFYEQNEKCAICNKVLIVGTKLHKDKACADHAHTVPPKPRGILCDRCNLGIANLQENPEIMLKAIAYLEKYR